MFFKKSVGSRIYLAKLRKEFLVLVWIPGKLGWVLNLDAVVLRGRHVIVDLG